MARQMIIDANLPNFLWPEAAKTAVYIQNRIPHRSINWQSPHEALAAYLGDDTPYWLQAKPDLSNIRIFGYKAYVRINKLPRLAKLALRAAIGYLVGYEAYNIWRIWIPTSRCVIRARDIQFNEDEFYDSTLPNQKIRIYEDTNLSQPITTLDDEETLRILDDIDIPDQTMQQDLGGGSPSTTANLDPAYPLSLPKPHIRLTFSLLLIEAIMTKSLEINRLLLHLIQNQTNSTNLTNLTCLISKILANLARCSLSCLLITPISILPATNRLIYRPNAHDLIQMPAETKMRLNDLTLISLRLCRPSC